MNKQNESSGMRLLSSGKRGFFRIVFSRVGLISLLLILQVALIFAVMLWFYKILPHLLVVQGLFVAVMVLILINSRADASSKITWLILIMSAPLFGTLMYVYVRMDVGHRLLRDRLRGIIGETKNLLPQEPPALETLTPPRSTPISTIAAASPFMITARSSISAAARRSSRSFFCGWRRQRTLSSSNTSLLRKATCGGACSRYSAARRRRGSTCA